MQVIEQYIQQGHYHIRSHCNVDPSIGTKHIEITKEAFSRYEQYITHEIVAFPQHGLLRSQVEPLMREALRMGQLMSAALIQPLWIVMWIIQSQKYLN